MAPMSQQRLRLIVISLASICALGWFLWWRSPSVQADRTFSLLRNAIENGRANGVINVIHPDYDFQKAWPNQINGNTGDLVGNHAMRLLVMRGLTTLFILQQADPFIFNYTLHDITTQDDGTYAVTVSINLLTRAGQRPLTFTPSLNSQRFILAHHGWGPGLSIIRHSPFTAAY
jgi:hypothetical protein